MSSWGVFLTSTLYLVASVASLAAAPNPATELKPVHLEIDAPVGCANANDFFSSLRARTHLVRQASENEPHTILQVRLLEMRQMRRYFLGELRMVDDRGETDTRRVQGGNCDDVVQALALAAAVALDPSVLLPPTMTIPAQETPAPAGPPPIVAPAMVELVDSRKPVNLPTSSASQLDPRFELGAVSVGSIFLSSGMSPGVAIVGRWTPTGIGVFRPTLGMAATYLRNDIAGSPGAAQASLTGLVVTLCGTGLGTRIVTVKPCGLVMAGLLSVSGHQVVRTSSVDLLWLSAGAAARSAVRLGRGFAIDLEAGVSAPFLKREFYTTVASHVVEKTPTISPFASLGLSYGF